MNKISGIDRIVPIGRTLDMGIKGMVTIYQEHYLE